MSFHHYSETIVKPVRLIIFVFSLVASVSVASGNAVETALENCSHVESPLDVALGCETHINCMFYTANANCTETTLVQLTRSCANIAFRLCVDMAALTVINMDDAILGFQELDTTTQLNLSLKAFVEGDYQTAIDLYENVTLALDYFPHYIHELGTGIIYLRFNNPDVALIQFDKSLNLEFYNPIAFYYRGNAYVQRGNDVRALRDHYMYDLLASEQLKATLPLRTFRIQIEDSQPWHLYPVYTMESSETRFEFSNETHQPLQPIVVSFVDNDETLVIADWLDIVAGSETEILFFERDPENPLRYILQINQQDVPDSVPSGKTEISVIASPLMLELYLKSTQSGEQTYITSLASPIRETDIRPANAIPSCENLPFSLLAIGATIQPLPPATELVLWDDPFVTTPLSNLDLDESSKPFRIVDGPVCYDQQLWWQVSNGTVTGWLPEHQQFPLTTANVFPTDYMATWIEDPPTPLQFLDLHSQTD